MWQRNSGFDVTKYNSSIFISEWLHFYIYFFQIAPFFSIFEWNINNFCEALVDFLSKCMRLTFNCNSAHETRSWTYHLVVWLCFHLRNGKVQTQVLFQQGILKLLITLVEAIEKKVDLPCSEVDFQKQEVNHHRNYLKTWTKLFSHQPLWLLKINHVLYPSKSFPGTRWIVLRFIHRTESCCKELHYGNLLQVPTRTDMFDSYLPNIVSTW